MAHKIWLPFNYIGQIISTATHENPYYTQATKQGAISASRLKHCALKYINKID